VCHQPKKETTPAQGLAALSGLASSVKTAVIVPAGPSESDVNTKT
jgi:hypothetical protein